MGTEKNDTIRIFRAGGDPGRYTVENEGHRVVLWTADNEVGSDTRHRCRRTGRTTVTCQVPRVLDVEVEAGLGADVVRVEDKVKSAYLSGKQDADRLFGAGDDLLVGGPGDDLLVGGPQRDDLMGGTGNDVERGGSGDDFLGGTGHFTDFGIDLFKGGPGKDEIAAQDETRDRLIDCGPPETDGLLRIDAQDRPRVRNC